MLKQFDKNNIDIIMKIWKDNNQRFQNFINQDYWADQYIYARDSFLESNIFVYTENEKILAYVSNNPINNEVLSIQVLPEIQREGIGTLLIENLKKSSSQLKTKVYEKNSIAIMFFNSMGFKKIDEELNEKNQEKYYILEWADGEDIDSSFIYFDNSIKNELIEKYDKENKVLFYDIHTFTETNNNIYNVDISNGLEKRDGKFYIKDYVEVRNKLNSIIKTKNITIFFDCKNKYDFLYDVIKDIAKVKSVNLKIAMHKPFSAEGTKKEKMYEEVLQAFEGYELLDIDYEQLGQDENITFKEAFDKRDEVLLQNVCK